MEPRLKKIKHQDNSWEYILLLGDKKIGGIGYKNYEDPPDWFFIHSVHIRSKYRNAGYGTNMLNQIINKCKEKNPHSLLLLSVREDNIKAIKFYERLGFSFDNDYAYIGEGPKLIGMKRQI